MKTDLREVKIEHQNKKEPRGRNALMRAALKGDVGKVQFILKNHDVDLNQKDKEGNTALLLTVAAPDNTQPRLPLFQTLYNCSGVDKTSVNNAGGNALTHAIGSGHRDVVKFLLDQPETQPNRSDNKGNTPLLHAAAGDLEMFKIVLEHPRIDKRSTSKNKALMRASRNGSVEIVKCLLHEEDVTVNEIDRYGNTALLIAAQRGHFQTFKTLFESPGVNKRAVNTDKRNSLMLASQKGHDSIVKFLLNHVDDIDLNAVDMSGNTALLWATKGTNSSCFETLFNHRGVNRKCTDKKGRNALMLASQTGRCDIVKFLLREHETEVNQVDKDGNTALLLAAAEGHVGTFDLLYDDPLVERETTNKEGKNAIALAQSEKIRKIIENQREKRDREALRVRSTATETLKISGRNPPFPASSQNATKFARKERSSAPAEEQTSESSKVSRSPNSKTPPTQQTDASEKVPAPEAPDSMYQQETELLLLKVALCTTDKNQLHKLASKIGGVEPNFVNQCLGASKTASIATFQVLTRWCSLELKESEKVKLLNEALVTLKAKDFLSLPEHQVNGSQLDNISPPPSVASSHSSEEPDSFVSAGKCSEFLKHKRK